MTGLPLDPESPDEGAGARPLHLRPAALALVFAGGALGTAARYGLAVGAPTTPRHWPLGTFVANVVGALVLGVLLEALVRAGSDEGRRRRARLLAGTGFCGGFTTYSTFAVESALLVRDHDAALAGGYIAASVLAGLVATTVGIAAAARVHRRRTSA